MVARLLAAGLDLARGTIVRRAKVFECQSTWTEGEGLLLAQSFRGRMRRHIRCWRKRTSYQQGTRWTPAATGNEFGPRALGC
jgi:hypothetical protein